MPIVVACKCQKKLRVKDELAGKKIKCPGCGDVLVVPAAEKVSAQSAGRPTKSSPKEVASEKLRRAKKMALDEGSEALIRGNKRSRPDDDDEDNRPKQRRPRPDDDDEDVRVSPDGAECWANFGDSQIIVLNDEGVWWSDLEGKELKKAMKAIEAGDHPTEVLPSDDISHVAYDAVRGAKMDHNMADCDFKFQGVDEDGKKSEKEFYFIFKEKDERVEFFESLFQRLGPGWKKRRENFSPGRAAMWPSISLLITIAATVGLMFVANWVSDWGYASGRGRARFFFNIFVWLGPTGVGIIGGLIAVCFLVYLILCVANPPKLVHIERAKKRRKRRNDD